jgi:competence protein ComEC
MPEISVISVGANNRYHHPNKGVVERLNTFGSKIYRTDKDGGIVIKSDGEKIELTPRPPLSRP